jgi:hypothetical protein
MRSEGFGVELSSLCALTTHLVGGEVAIVDVLIVTIVVLAGDGWDAFVAYVAFARECDE